MGKRLRVEMGFSPVVLIAAIAMSVAGILLESSKAEAQNSGYWLEQRMFDKCADRLTEDKRLEFENLPSRERLGWLEANCAGGDRGGRARAWEIYERCKPNLTPAQTREFESSDREARKRFLVKHCKKELEESVAKSREEEAKDAKSTPKIAFVGIWDDAGEERGDVQFLEELIERSAKEEVAGRFELVTLERDAEGQCDADCMRGRAASDGAAYVLRGDLRSFGGGLVLTLSLDVSSSGVSAASAVTEGMPMRELPSAVGEAVRGLIGKISSKEEGPRRKSSAGKGRARSNPPGRGEASSRLHRSDGTGPMRPSPGRPPSYAGARVAAHVFFWLGLDAIVGGVVWLANGYNEMGISALSIGGVFCIVAGIAAGAYSKKKEALRRWERLSGGPVVSPHFAGFALSRRF